MVAIGGRDGVRHSPGNNFIFGGAPVTAADAEGAGAVPVIFANRLAVYVDFEKFGSTHANAGKIKSRI